MATVSIEGGQLKIVNGTRIDTIPVDDVVMESVGSDSILFKQCNAPVVELVRTAISSPSSTDVEDLIDQIGVLTDTSSSVGGLTPTTQTGASYAASDGDLVVINVATHTVTLPSTAANLKVGVTMVNATVTDIQVKTDAAAETINGTDYSSTGLAINNQYDMYEFFTYTLDGGSTYVWGIKS